MSAMDQIKSQQASRTIELWFNKADGLAPWTIGHAVLRDDGQVQRIRFDQAKPVEAALVPELTRVIMQHLETASKTSVYSDRAFELDLPGVSIAGYRLLTWAYDGGRVSASARFNCATGFMPAVFSDSAKPERTPHSAIDRAALRALDDLLLPALEMYDQIVEQGFAEVGTPYLEARLKTMAEKRDQLSQAVNALAHFLPEAQSDTDAQLRDQTKQRAQLRARDTPFEVRWDPEKGWERSLLKDVDPNSYSQPTALTDCSKDGSNLYVRRHDD